MLGIGSATGVGLAQPPLANRTGFSGASTRGSHRLGSALSCETLFYLRYGKGLVLNDESDTKSWRVIGSLGHVLLAYHYGYRMPKVPDQMLRTPIERELQRVGEGFPTEISTAINVFNYWRRAFTNDNWVPVLVEHEAHAYIGELDSSRSDPEIDKEIVTVRWDLIFLHNDTLNVADHKFMGGNSKRLERWTDRNEYTYSTQGMLYLKVARLRLEPLFQKRVDAFHVQRIKRTVEYDADRHPVNFSPVAYNDLGKYCRAAVTKEREIFRKVELKESLSKNYSACYGRYGPCDYIAICHASSREAQTASLKTKFRLLDR